MAPKKYNFSPYFKEYPDSVIAIQTRLRAGRAAAQIPEWTKRLDHTGVQ
jgi:hypothetical protein